MNKVHVTFSKGKAKNVKYTIKRLWDYIYKFRLLFIIIFISNIVANVLSLYGPRIVGIIIEDISNSNNYEVNFDFIKNKILTLLIIYTISSLLSLVIALLLNDVSKRIVYTMRKDAFDKMMKLSISYYDNHQIGDIISRLSYDIDTINTSLSTDLIQICTSIITVIGSLIMMIIESKLLVLVFVITIPLSFVFTKLMVKKTSKYFKERSKSLGDLNAYMEEVITGVKTIKTYKKEESIISNFNEYNVSAADKSYMAEYYSAYVGPGVNFVNNLSLSLICLFGAVLYKLEKIRLRQISSFVLYSKKFSGPINEIANIITDIQSSLAAAERVFELIDEDTEKEDFKESLELTDIKGDVLFNNVYFGYTNDVMILKDLSFFIDKGKTIAIVGPTGSGKTTIVNLLMRFYDINSGIITIDNSSIEHVTRKSLRKSFAMVLQDSWLFEGSIFDNIAYGIEDASLDEVKRVCELAKISSFIENLPNGYDTILTEGGVNISKGQKQLLTIARAMLLNTNMLILDEATSNVDTITEIKIQEAMNSLMKDKTCFIIAHRLSTIKNADLILVLKNGTIIEQGTNKELLSKKGFYYELYNSQYK